jgi:hypothetical protein
MGQIRRWNVAGCTLVITAAMTSSSCFFGLGHKQRARVFIPPPQPASTADAKVPPPDLPAPPPVATSEDASPAPQAPAVVVLTPPPPAPAKRPPTPAPKAQAPPPPEPAPAAVTPRLGQIFTPQELQEYNRSLKDSFDRVDSALAKLEGKRLNPAQMETADRIRTFRKQAEQAREQDLVTAVSLAKRADLLAKDLLERLP